jgi:hypothetical protein
MKASPAIIRGRLTPAERAEIERLALRMRKPMPGPIARKLNRHVATVTWFMIRNGLIERPLHYGHQKPHVRNGIAVRPYSAPEDRRIVALRIEGKIPREIAEIITAELGIRRTGHSVNVRLTMLAAYSGSPDDFNPAQRASA